MDTTLETVIRNHDTEGLRQALSLPRGAGEEGFRLGAWARWRATRKNDARYRDTPQALSSGLAHAARYGFMPGIRMLFPLVPLDPIGPGNAPDETNHDACLKWAAQEGHLDATRFFLSQGTLVDPGDALVFAARNGRRDVVAFLLAPEHRNPAWYNEEKMALAARRAAENGHDDVATLLVHAAEPFWHAQMLASIAGQVRGELLDRLLPSLAAPSLGPALWEAAARGQKTTLLQLLPKTPASAHPQAVVQAALSSHPQVLVALLDRLPANVAESAWSLLLEEPGERTPRALDALCAHVPRAQVLATAQSHPTLCTGRHLQAIVMAQNLEGTLRPSAPATEPFTTSSEERAAALARSQRRRLRSRL